MRIDKRENPYLKDLANRQGIEENTQYALFLDIIDIGLKIFEEYRQAIIRAIGAYREEASKSQKTPVAEAIMSGKLKLDSVSEQDFRALRQELSDRKMQDKQAKKDAEEVEERHRYDVRILNVLATAGLKAASIAHQLKNDENNLVENSAQIRKALIEYGIWDYLSGEDRTRFSYRNVPALLETGERLNMKMAEFVDAVLAEIEKKRFEAKACNIDNELNRLIARWEADYSQLHIRLNSQLQEMVNVPPDAVQVIFDNLILNTYQQNNEKQNINVKIDIARAENGFIAIEYRDDGAGLPKKFKEQPRRILSVHETSRENGHGLGMWIVNNTLIGLGGTVLEIGPSPGFTIIFTIRG